MKLLILTAGFLFLPALGQSSLFRVWTYADLISEADTVVIAIPTDVKESAAIVPLPGMFTAGGNGNQGPVKSHEVETAFDVRGVLKGNVSIKKFVLHHYSLDARGLSVISDGPSLVSFEPKDRRSFILFLKKEKGGRFSPVSGQADARRSVQLLGPP